VRSSGGQAGGGVLSYANIILRLTSSSQISRHVSGSANLKGDEDTAGIPRPNVTSHFSDVCEDNHCTGYSKYEKS
jgi:hypothetical protein